MPIENLIKIRRGTDNQWNEANPILEMGEPGFDSTNNIFKIGNGSSNWNNLSLIANGSQIEQYEEVINFPNTGVDSVLYVSKETNKIYRWDEDAYVEIGSE